MKIIKKNQIIVYVLVLILMVAGYLNYTNNTENQLSVETTTETESTDNMQLADIGDATLVNSNDVKEENVSTETTENIEDNGNNSDIETSSTTDEQNYFIQSKLERENMYSQMIETYEKVLNSTSSLETQKQSTTEEIQKINKIKNSIMICENLIKIKGFENNIIFVNGQSINIVIETEELTQEKIAQIQNIISREMEANIENIHITNK